MADLLKALQPRIDAENAAREQEQKVADQAKRSEEIAEWERLERLMQNRDVQWLLGEFQKRVDIEHAMAVSTDAPDDVANKARHRHRAVKDLTDMLKERHMQMKNRIFEEKPA